MKSQISDRLDPLDGATRAIVLELLDELTQPLDRRSIEKALGRAGLTRGQRTKLMPTFLTLDLIALVPREV